MLLSDARPLGHALVDRELYLPKVWTDDAERCRQAGIPTEQSFATKPQLAPQMLARAFEAGVPATWITGDSVYGADRRLRRWLESRAQPYILAVSGQEEVWLGTQQRQGNTLWASLPAAGWPRRSVGDGTKGPRWYDSITQKKYLNEKEKGGRRTRQNNCFAAPASTTAIAALAITSCSAGPTSEPTCSGGTISPG